MKIENYDFNIVTYKELKLSLEENKTLFWSLNNMIKYCNDRIIEIIKNPNSIGIEEQIEFYKKTIDETSAIKEKLKKR